MGSCSVTKLKESLNFDNLETLNTLNFTSNGNRSKGDGITVYADSNTKTCSFKVRSGNGSFNDQTVITTTTVSIGTQDSTYTYRSGTGIRSLDGNPVTCSIENMAGLSGNITGIAGAISINLSRLFIYLPNAKYIRNIGSRPSGNITLLKSLDDIPTSIIQLALSNTCDIAVEEDISKLARLVNATIIEISNSDKITGNISSLGGLTNLSNLTLAYQRIGGTLEEFAAAQIAAGRPNGNLTFRVYGGNNNVTYKGSKSHMSYYTVIHFDSSRPSGYYVTDNSGEV